VICISSINGVLLSPISKFIVFKLILFHLDLPMALFVPRKLKFQVLIGKNQQITF